MRLIRLFLLGLVGIASLYGSATPPYSTPLNPPSVVVSRPQGKRSLWQTIRTKTTRFWQAVKRLFQSDQELIRLLIIVAIIAIAISIVIWLTPWPVNVIVSLIGLIILLIFLLRYLKV
ncbi:MAG: hypothetical protein NZ958_00795 [Bacteroidia bacterium]|nr:hypothetical protein [Bacteroidia bacterium]MDW8089542.1 hypothetical protein [Bacteroidia bacterium]